MTVLEDIPELPADVQAESDSTEEEVNHPTNKQRNPWKNVTQTWSANH